MVLAFGGVGLAVAVARRSSRRPSAPRWRPGCPPAYAAAQYFGWQWGKRVSPREAARFHSVLLVSVLARGALLLTTVDPVRLTEYMLVFSAVVLPLTYLPILVVANDRTYLGDEVNGPVAQPARCGVPAGHRGGGGGRDPVDAVGTGMGR